MLARLFGSRENAININSMTIYLASFATPVDYFFAADLQQTEPQLSKLFSQAILGNLLVTQIAGDTGVVRDQTKPRAQTIFRFTAVDVSPQSKPFSLFPVFNTLAIGWSADVDFLLEIDFTVLDAPWNYKEEIMNLLANKRQVEDPNISNTQGKRQLVRAPLLMVDE